MYRFTSNSSAATSNMEFDYKGVIVLNSDSDSPEEKSSPTSSLSEPTDFTFGYSNRLGSCPTVEYQEFFKIRSLARDEDKMPGIVLDENAGRNISEVVFHIIPQDFWPHLVHHPHHRTIIILIGLDDALARIALAAGRHLHERGFRVVACDLDEGRFPGTALYAATKSEDVPRFFGEVQYWDETQKIIRATNSPPRLVIDALGDRTVPTALDREYTGHMCAWKNTLLEMIAAMNSSRSPVMSINCPTGLDPIDGSVLLRDGRPVVVRPQHVVSCGVPLHALLQAYNNPAAGFQIHGWYVCDIGINNALCRYTHDIHGIGRRVTFHSGWWAQLRPCRPVR